MISPTVYSESGKTIIQVNFMKSSLHSSNSHNMDIKVIPTMLYYVVRGLVQSPCGKINTLIFYPSPP